MITGFCNVITVHKIALSDQRSTDIGDGLCLFFRLKPSQSPTKSKTIIFPSCVWSVASSANLCSVKAGANSLISELRRLHSIDIRQSVERADSFGIVLADASRPSKQQRYAQRFPLWRHRVKCRSECRPLDNKFYWLALRPLARSRGSKSPGITSGPYYFIAGTIPNNLH